MELSIVMPCLNEARTLPSCIRKAQRFLLEHGVVGEIVIGDNGSSDGSARIAGELGARVVHVRTRGYGAAIRGACLASRGKFIIMGDSDDSYDFGKLAGFVHELRGGCDLVVGNRFQGGIRPGAMPWKNRCIGNPALSWVGRLLFGSPCGDFHCGLRGFSRHAFDRLDLKTIGMELASEMIIKASLSEMKVTEVPTLLSKDGRARPPHLRPWHDGWRHLRFMLLLSPRWVFFYPGAALLVAGLTVGGLIVRAPLVLGGVTFDVNTLVFSALTVLVGLQAVVFSGLTEIFSRKLGLVPAEKSALAGRALGLEASLGIGLALIAAGALGWAWAFGYWKHRGFGPLDPRQTLRRVLPYSLAIIGGIQVILNGSFAGLLQLAVGDEIPIEASLDPVGR